MAASFTVELIYDICIGTLVLLFAFTGGLPQAAGLRRPRCLRPLLLRPAPRFALFDHRAGDRDARRLRAPVGAGGCLLARVKQGLTILRDRQRYLRQVFGVQFAGWLFRFAAFWMLLRPSAWAARSRT